MVICVECLRYTLYERTVQRIALCHYWFDGIPNSITWHNSKSKMNWTHGAKKCLAYVWCLYSVYGQTVMWSQMSNEVNMLNNNYAQSIPIQFNSIQSYAFHNLIYLFLCVRAPRSIVMEFLSVVSIVFGGPILDPQHKSIKFISHQFWMLISLLC